MISLNELFNAIMNFKFSGVFILVLIIFAEFVLILVLLSSRNSLKETNGRIRDRLREEIDSCAGVLLDIDSGKSCLTSKKDKAYTQGSLRMALLILEFFDKEARDL